MNNEKQQYDVLISRVERLVDELETYQEKCRVTIGVDLYWYIQKLQEFKLVREQLAMQKRPPLEQYLETVSTQLIFRLAADEQKMRRISPSTNTPPTPVQRTA